MSLADVITNAVATAKTVTEGLQISVAYRSCTGWSAGVRTFAASTNHSVLIVHKEKMVRAEDGKEHLSVTQIYFLEPKNISMEDEITLPDGKKPQILSVDGLMNPSGVMYNPTVYF
jgi:hypothetical protein